MECPYCGAEWEHEYDDLSYTDGEGEYECPECERIFIMDGELEPVFFAETAEDYYERKIINIRDIVNFYKDKIDQYIERGDSKNAEYYKAILDIYLLPKLKELEKALKRCIEHNKKVGEENENNKNNCKNL